VSLVYLLGWWLIVLLGTEEAGATCFVCGWRLVAYHLRGIIIMTRTLD
jgi:hypothetical protein